VPAHEEQEGIPAVALSPDGRTHLTAGARGSGARLWDRASGKLLREFRSSTPKATRAVAYSPDGRTIVTGSDDQTARLWDADTGQPLGEPFQHPACVASVGFSPNGEAVLTGSQDNLARIWDVATGKPVGKTFAHQSWVLAAVFSPDGRMALTGSKDGTARLWDRETGLPVGPPLRHDKGPVGLDWVPAVAFRPNGSTVVSGGMDQAARFRPVHEPVEGTPERVSLWVETISGMTLAASGVVHPLDAAGWHERRQRLDQLGGPPSGRQNRGSPGHPES
jgi:WD40 repeat protein